MVRSAGALHCRIGQVAPQAKAETETETETILPDRQSAPCQFGNAMSLASLHAGCNVLGIKPGYYAGVCVGACDLKP